MNNEPEYQVEEAPANAKSFFAKRWVRVTGISAAAALALAGAFGVGVVAGEKIAGSNNTMAGQFGQQFGHDGQNGLNGQFPGGQNGQFQGGPGGCPANDPDHCAGTDRNQHNFKLPSTGTNSGSTTTNP